MALIGNGAGHDADRRRGRRAPAAASGQRSSRRAPQGEFVFFCAGPGRGIDVEEESSVDHAVDGAAIVTVSRARPSRFLGPHGRQQACM